MRRLGSWVSVLLVISACGKASPMMGGGDDDPTTDAIYQVGTLASVLQLLKLPDGTVKVLVEGKSRARVIGFEQSTPFFMSLPPQT